jgi:predicted 3-demethylubiquinone-9 3-methyltransferase (glyoxalase superfamily)
VSKITTFFMFDGKAEEAINFYTSIFDQSEINSIVHHEDGTVLHAIFTIKGQTFMCIDSRVQHEFTFTPSISLFVTCDTEKEIDDLFEKLSQDGQVLMPLASSPVSKKFGWVTDRYGVSWQLNLPNKQ